MMREEFITGTSGRLRQQGGQHEPILKDIYLLAYKVNHHFLYRRFRFVRTRTVGGVSVAFKFNAFPIFCFISFYLKCQSFQPVTVFPNISASDGVPQHCNPRLPTVRAAVWSPTNGNIP